MPRDGSSINSRALSWLLWAVYGAVVVGLIRIYAGIDRQWLYTVNLQWWRSFLK